MKQSSPIKKMYFVFFLPKNWSFSPICRIIQELNTVHLVYITGVVSFDRMKAAAQFMPLCEYVSRYIGVIF